MVDCLASPFINPHPASLPTRGREASTLAPIIQTLHLLGRNAGDPLPLVGRDTGWGSRRAQISLSCPTAGQTHSGARHAP
jgi:hypothetical protein